MVLLLSLGGVSLDGGLRPWGGGERRTPTRKCLSAACERVKKAARGRERKRTRGKEREGERASRVPGAASEETRGQDASRFGLWRRSFPGSLLRLPEDPAVRVQTLERCRRGSGQREVKSDRIHAFTAAERSDPRLRGFHELTYPPPFHASVHHFIPGY